MPFGPVGIHQPTSLLFLLLAYVTIPILSKPPKQSDYYNLTDFIFDGYKKEVRPVLDDADYTNITISLSIFQLIDISEEDEIDEYLSWDETDYGNINSFLVKQGSIWVPDIVVGNTVTTQTQLGYKDLQVSLLMVYILLLLALTAFSVVLSVFLLKLHHRPSNKPLGRKTTKIIILLQKLMCSADDPRQTVEVEVKRSSQDNNVSIVGQYKRQMTESNAISPCDNSQESDESSCRCACNTRTRRSSELNPVSGQVAAETLSSFLFIVFVVLTVVSTTFCFVVLVVGGARQQEKLALPDCHGTV